MATKTEKKMIAAFYHYSEQVPEMKAKIAFYESIVRDPADAYRTDTFRIWGDLPEETRQYWRDEVAAT